jgi:hypothetical protein
MCVFVSPTSCPAEVLNCESRPAPAWKPASTSPLGLFVKEMQADLLFSIHYAPGISR